MNAPIALHEIAEARRGEILAASADSSEPRFLRAVARALHVELPVLAIASGLPVWRVERTLNLRRIPDPETLAAVRRVLGVTEVDVRAAKLAAMARDRRRA